MTNSLSAAIAWQGVGVHSGKHCRVSCGPGPRGLGVVFTRSDVPGTPRVRAGLDHAEALPLRTRLAAGAATVETVEHLLAALYALELTDVEAVVDGPEVPVLDGSALEFVERLDPAVQPVAGTTVEFRVETPLVLEAHGARYEARASDSDTIGVTFEWPHALVGRQEITVPLTPAAFRERIAPARTFGYARDADRLRRRGLALGATRHNTGALDDEGVVNGPLRFRDEFVRHKALDLIGDLALLGGRFRGEIRATQPNHRANLAFVRALRTHCNGRGD